MEIDKFMNEIIAKRVLGMNFRVHSLGDMVKISLANGATASWTWEGVAALMQGDPRRALFHGTLGLGFETVRLLRRKLYLQPVKVVGFDVDFNTGAVTPFNESVLMPKSRVRRIPDGS
ncbi:MAG: hypothetical protein Q7R49_03080 [Candidatus Daviesbacteria bacterium]|nr:hypothetical protein [Candidatus Daviesbacteria bacterium]